MTWERAEDLAITLLRNGRSGCEVIKKLCEATDRYRGRAKDYSERLTLLRKELIEAKKQSGRIIQITVDSMQTYGYHKVVWYRSQAYTYHSNGVWLPARRSLTQNEYPDSMYYGKFKVWIEVAEQDRDIVCSGEVSGFLKGMTCITLDPQTQKRMYLNHGDRVVLTKVRKQP